MKFWKWQDAVLKNENGESTQVSILELNGTIAEESWWDDEVTPEIFKAELNAQKGDIEVWINSPGGDCIAASRIYSMLTEYGKKNNVTVKIDGIAASAASVVAMAGTKVLMAPTAMMMVHNPSTMAYGNHDELGKAIEMLDEVKESIINAYELKTHKSRNFLSKLMDEVTWMNAKRAIELGFADAMLEKSSPLSNEAEGYSFSSKKSEQVLLNALKDKAKKENPIIDNRPTVGELLEKLDLRWSKEKI